MSPDSPETRLGRLETAVARLEQRTDDLSTDVRTLTPLIVQVAEIKITMAQVQVEVHAATQASTEIVKRLDTEREERRKGQQARVENERRDSKNFRRTLIGIGIAAVLSPVFTLVITLLQGRHGG